MAAEKKEASENSWQDKVFQYGLFLIILGLIGLICPAFGLQLRQLRRLGEMQWIVLFVMVIAGCGVVLWSRRDQLILGLMITGGALPAMLLFAYFSFWRPAGDAPVAQEAPHNIQNGSQSRPPPVPTPDSTPPPTSFPETGSVSSPTPDATRDPTSAPTPDPTPAPAPVPAPIYRPVTSPFVNARSTHFAGHERGQRFTDSVPPGGLLVGLRCAKGRNWGGALQAVQPIYQVGKEDVLGKRLGKPGGEEIELRAKPGYAVGAIHANVGLVLNAVRLVFYRVKDQRLDPDDRYESEWVGSEGGSPFDMNAQGAPIAEIFGTWQDDLVSLGIKPVESPSSAVPLIAGTPSDSSPETSAAATSSTAPLNKAPLRGGHASGKPFADEAPPGGLLVGLRCAKGKNWGGALQAVQPIYQVGTRYVKGRRHGKPGGVEQELLAKPGYAVGAIHARIGLVVNALQLSFYRISGGRLDPNDHYESPWVGSDGGGPVDLDAKGDPITGFSGSWVEDLVSLGCTPTASLSAPAPLAESSTANSSATESAPAEFRQWISSDGKSKVEAKMVGKDKDSVRLRRRDGKVVTVPLTRLSPSDVEYVRSGQ